MNRRKFVSASAVAAVLAMAEGRKSGVHSLSPREGTVAPRVGISDAAYQQAWTKAASLVARMTLKEKISQTGSGSPSIARLGLPAYSYGAGECLHGLANGAPATAFPLPLAMVCSWNPSLALKVYTAVSDEARGYHNSPHNGGLSFFSPQTLNLHRDPRWGRCQEAPGEDPCLAATWTVEVLRGMQGSNPKYLKTTCSIKHFMCNNTEDDRFSASASVNPRSFWEYYTRAYRACVVEADVFAVMSAYSAINGMPCSADHFLLTNLLRDRWGFRGYVVSDCDAVAVIAKGHHYVPTLHQAAALAMQAGCDVNCGNTYQDHLKKAVADDLISEANISRAVTRLLAARVLLGEFDPPENVPYSKIGFDVVDSTKHRALALDAARQSIVLLKNANNFLPLKKAELKNVAVIGPTAAVWNSSWPGIRIQNVFKPSCACHLGGYSASPVFCTSPYDGIAEALGFKMHTSPERIWPDELTGMSSGVQTQASSEGGMNICWIDDGSWLEYKPQNFSGKHRIAIRVASLGRGATIHVHVDSLDGPHIATLTAPHTGGWQTWTTVSAAIRSITGKHKVFFKFSGNPGHPICNMEWFQLESAAAMPKSRPQSDHPVVVCKPGCSVDGPKDEMMFAEAVSAAKNADAVIMVCGVDQRVDCEGHDRVHIGLPGVQHELIQACYQANPKTVLVLNSNNTVAVNWEQEHLPAIVSAVFAGQAQGTAIADVLFGNYNPGGKTCCTWYKSIDQLPPFHDYDIMKGRTYMYLEDQPLYPFGYGLSYTQFKFADFKVSADSLSEGGSVQVSVQITNTGDREGAEVAQFYVTAPKSPVKRPLKQLVGFERVELKAGESKKVMFTLPYNEQALWYWDEDQRKFVLQAGRLKLMVGSSSADTHLVGKINLQACTSSAKFGGPETLTTVAVGSVSSEVKHLTE
jgi:beta-glucosidase